MASTLDLLDRLNRCAVEYVLIGGMAAVVHGSQLVTEDVDICAPLDETNLERIVAALSDLQPKFRTSPDRRALPAEPSELAGFKNLYPETDMGQLDILSEVSGVGDYGAVASQAITLDLEGVACRVLDLDALIRSKRAMGRPRDLQAALELEAVRARLRSKRD